MAMQPRDSPCLVGGLRGLELSGGMASSSASEARIPCLSGDHGGGVIPVEHSGDGGSGAFSDEHSGVPAIPSAVSFRKDPQISCPLAVADEDGNDTRRRLQSSLEKSDETRLSVWVAHDNAIHDVCRIKRARSLSPPGRLDSVQRTRSRVEVVGSSKADMASTLPDDVLLEVFNRLPPPAAIFRCAAVCRRWRRVVSGASACCLPAPPRHFGFFRNYGPSPLPPFVPTAGIGLDLGFLPVSPACGAILVDCRGHRLLLRELGAGFAAELRLLVCNPLEKTFARLPALPVGRHTVSCYAVIPSEGAAFRVVIVLFGAASPNFYILVYSSASAAWEAATGPLKQPLISHQGPSVVIGDVVYRLQCEGKYIMAVNTTKMSLSALPLPNAGMPLYAGNNWIGKTEDDRLCFFAIQEPLVLVKWVLEAPGKWGPQVRLPLQPLLNPATVGDLHGMKLSAKIADQLHGCKLVSFGGFCEGSGTLFFIMADWVVALDLKTLKMEKLWSNTDESRPLGDVFPYEMVAWPPAIKDSAKALLLDEA